MIGAPSDIRDEVEIVKNVLNIWNTINSDKEKIVLLPKYWADSTYPEVGIRPQTAINKQIVEDSDLLISIFGAKLGSPTGVSQSGSIEEIEEHIKAGKNVMVFFKKFGSYYDIDTEQLKQLQEYRKSNKDNVFWAEYDNPGEFKELLNKKLQLFLNKNWLKADVEEILSDEEVFRETDRRISSLERYETDFSIREKGEKPDEFKYPRSICDDVFNLQEALMKEVEERGVYIECNPSSNLKIGPFERYEDLAITRFLGVKEPCKHRINISINTDDRGVFSTSIHNEYSLMAIALTKARDEKGVRVYTDDEICNYLGRIIENGYHQRFEEPKMREY